MKSVLFNKRDVIAYFFVAASGVPIQLLISSVTQNWFGISYRESLTVAYLVASVVGFFLTKIFAFSTKNATKTHREMVKFTMVAILSFLITVYGSDALNQFSVESFGVQKIMIPHSVKSVEVNKFLSQLACMGVSFVSNFILHKRFTFRDTGFYERLKKLL